MVESCYQTSTDNEHVSELFLGSNKHCLLFITRIAKLLRNPRMRAVRDGASRAGKSRPALLGSRMALLRGFSQ